MIPDLRQLLGSGLAAHSSMRPAAGRSFGTIALEIVVGGVATSRGLHQHAAADQGSAERRFFSASRSHNFKMRNYAKRCINYNLLCCMAL
jgi:hypothetical protein